MPPSATSRSSWRRAEAGPRGPITVHLGRSSAAAAAECVRRLWDPWLDKEAVQVEHDPDGVPWARVRERRLPLSLTHSDGHTAAAGHLELRVGIDLERLRPLPPAHAPYFLSPGEENALSGWDDPATATLAAWVVKEAVLKARGRGLRDPPRSVRIRSLAERGVELANPEVVAGCWRQGNHVVAVACVGANALPPVEVSGG
jgi:phosphopantetheinyl transferase